MLLYEHQRKAVDKLHNGSILCGGVGTGKSRTSIGWFLEDQCYKIPEDAEDWEDIHPWSDPPFIPANLYIITTAKKRDTKEWEGDMLPFGLSTDILKNKYGNKVTVDSWNNIQKYEKVSKAYFIFDEQKVVGSGAWVRSFLKIAKSNKWILLSATPGDKWIDYCPVFVANGFYKNRSEFKTIHCCYNYYGGYPQLVRYYETDRLHRQLQKILVPMTVRRDTEVHNCDVECDYDKQMYKDILKTRINPVTKLPFQGAADLCYALRREANSDPSRIDNLRQILSMHPKLIVFYNYDYELDILKTALTGLTLVAEWNGHKHEDIPKGDSWCYLVNYSSGAEGWNCIETDTIVFYSQTYSFRTLAQSKGRIDRMNTPFNDLYYYHMVSKAPIDIAIRDALKNKKVFNERNYINER